MLNYSSGLWPSQLIDPCIERASTRWTYVPRGRRTPPDSSSGLARRTTTATGLVTTHDRSGVDELIISAGAPTKQGLAFPSDGVLASLVLGAAEERALEATPIRRVFVHAWQGRGIAELTPNEIR